MFSGASACLRLAQARSLTLMRAIALLLAFVIGAMPTVQAYAGTVGQAHCHKHGHSMGASPQGQAPSHAHHHGAMSADQAMDPAMQHMQHAMSDGAHCKCGCLCSLACAVGAAMVAHIEVMPVVHVHEHWATAISTGHAISVQHALLRPPSRLL